MRELVAGYADAVFEDALDSDRTASVRDELSATLAVIEGQSRLRQVLTDPALAESTRRAILTELLENKVSAETLSLSRFVIRSERASDVPTVLASLVIRAHEILGEGRPPAFSDSRLAVRARVRGYAERILAGLTSTADIDEVEDELFRLARLFDSSRELRSALTDLGRPPSTRIAIADELLAGKVRPATLRLVHYVINAGRLRDIVGTFDWLVDLTAQERGRRVGKVRSAVDLDPAERDRLAEALGRLVERPVEVRVIIDPTVVGGAFVAVGDLVIDGTVRLRLERLRDLLAPAR